MPAVRLSGSGELTVTGEVTSSPDWAALSADERVAKLIQTAAYHEQRLVKLSDEVQSQGAELRAAIVSERERAEAEARRIESRVELFVGNDLRLQAIGAGLLFFGILLTTWSGEIVRNRPFLLAVVLLALTVSVAVAAKLIRSRRGQRAGDPDDDGADPE